MIDMICRAVTAAGGTAYVYLAYLAGLKGDRFWLLLDCLIAGFYFFGMGKSHSRMKRQPRRG